MLRAIKERELNSAVIQYVKLYAILHAERIDAGDGKLLGFWCNVHDLKQAAAMVFANFAKELSFRKINR